MNYISRRNNVVSTVGFLFSPLVGMVFSVIGLSSIRSNKYKHLLISLSIFVFILYMPPMADLFRHYSNFMDYGGEGLGYLVGRSMDITLPVVMYIFHSLNIPFYFISPLFVSISSYLLLNALEYSLKNYSGGGVNAKIYVAINISALCLMPVFIIASGLRFGMASFIMIYAIYGYSSSRFGVKQYLIWSIIAALTHFSVFVFALLPFGIKFLSPGRWRVFIYFLISAFVSVVVVPILISSIPSLNTAYAQAYFFGKYSNLESKNLNGLIVYSFQFFPTFILLLYFILNRMSSLDFLRKVCAFVVVITSLSMFSAELFQRFNIIAMFALFLYFSLSFCSHEVRLNKTIPFLVLLILSVVYFSFQSVYVFRKQVMLGGMWQGVYTTPFYKLITVDDDFGWVVKQLNSSTGEWIGHETASD